MEARRVAIVGAGVSGLTAAYLLRESHDVTVFEAQSRLGGHAHTHDVSIGQQTVPVDSGFIVLNDRTYPTLRRLFNELGVAIEPTEMSMSISCQGCGLGYVGGRGVGGIFAQRRRVADPRFLRLLVTVARFRRAALKHLDRFPNSLETYGDFLERLGFHRDFVQHYAVPIVTCVWSSGANAALDYPAAYLFAFLRHHGFLEAGTAPQWYVVRGGSRNYVQAIDDKLQDVRRADQVTAIARSANGVELTSASGATHRVDRVVIATHADEALGLLTDATELETRLLGSFGYSTNATQLHRDLSVLPNRRSERASWNVSLDGCNDSPDDVRVSYWMNRLQGHDESSPLVVTLNGKDDVDAGSVIAEMDYTHPIYTPNAVSAQWRLSELNTSQTAFAGAYHGWGFHEDGCRSGAAAAAHFGATW